VRVGLGWVGLGEQGARDKENEGDGECRPCGTLLRKRELGELREGERERELNNDGVPGAITSRMFVLASWVVVFSFFLYFNLLIAGPPLLEHACDELHDMKRNFFSFWIYLTRSYHDECFDGFCSGPNSLMLSVIDGEDINVLLFPTSSSHIIPPSCFAARHLTQIQSNQPGP
jgi:hypothetical protein